MTIRILYIVAALIAAVGFLATITPLNYNCANRILKHLRRNSKTIIADYSEFNLEIYHNEYRLLLFYLW